MPLTLESIPVFDLDDAYLGSGGTLPDFGGIDWFYGEGTSLADVSAFVNDAGGVYSTHLSDWYAGHGRGLRGNDECNYRISPIALTDAEIRPYKVSDYGPGWESGAHGDEYPLIALQRDKPPTFSVSRRWRKVYGAFRVRAWKAGEALSAGTVWWMETTYVVCADLGLQENAVPERIVMIPHKASLVMGTDRHGANPCFARVTGQLLSWLLLRPVQPLLAYDAARKLVGTDWQSPDPDDVQAWLAWASHQFRRYLQRLDEGEFA